MNLVTVVVVQSWYPLFRIPLLVSFEIHHMGYELPFNWIQSTASYQGWPERFDAAIRCLRHY